MSLSCRFIHRGFRTSAFNFPFDSHEIRERGRRVEEKAAINPSESVGGKEGQEEGAAVRLDLSLFRLLRRWLPSREGGGSKLPRKKEERKKIC